MKTPLLSIFSIAVATALSILGDAMMYVVLPSYFDHIGLRPLQVGILLSINRWIRLASNPLAERCYRNFPVEIWLVPAFLLASLVTATYGTFKIFGILLVARALWGICYSFIRQAGIMTVVSVSNDTHLGAHMGLYSGINSTGWFLGMFLAGLGHDLFGFTFTLIVFSLVSLISAPLAHLSQRGLNVVKTSPLSLKISNMKTNLGMMLCGFAVGFVGLGLIISTLGLILREQVGMSVNLFGYPIGIATITGMVLAVRWILGIGSPLMGAMADRIGRERSVPLIYIVGAIAMGLAGLSVGSVLFICGVLVTLICVSLLAILIFAWAGQHGGRTLASCVTAYDFGSALGPIIGWSIAQLGLPIKIIFVIGIIFYTLCAFVSKYTLEVQS